MKYEHSLLLRMYTFNSIIYIYDDSVIYLLGKHLSKRNRITITKTLLIIWLVKIHYDNTIIHNILLFISMCINVLSKS